MNIILQLGNSAFSSGEQNIVEASVSVQDKIDGGEETNLGEISSGKGLNQETTLKRLDDSHWGSHYNSLLSLILMFSTTIDVIEMIATNDISCGKRGEARILLGSMLTFDFVFSLHLKKNILSISNELSKSLQRRDQDIVNAMKLVKICKERL
ncbi:uncharacterized protein LOC111385940 [Olea europaea var. sylvestris]|uniref:uncharacterized protein LOC111385940 n=1 Tax=Olea europaea var. sylvestris TaxID=158386 RepID=UPI000C1D210A|nr:uncharacterized protein LOC111385940 [Olea europaea var. sylvestris]